jgi:nicotinate-nucleotide pyrophosphorylase (carboxylating)
MVRDFRQIEWDEDVAEDCRELVRLAVREDLEREQDWTTLALAPARREGAADVVARQLGVVAGMSALELAVGEMSARIVVERFAEDGQIVQPGTAIARLRGNVRDLLTCERTLLNLLGRLMGVATLARNYVDQVAGTKARIYDTRKTTLGWRRLEKYAVRCGGACNHRLGLYDAILIKDNHLAQSAEAGASSADAAAWAVRQARRFLADLAGSDSATVERIVEIEVDTAEQLAAVLPVGPDLVLLDNMSIDQLAAAVALRDQVAPGVELEASGGVNLETVRGIALTGVDRISVGAMTHGARWLDIGLDWISS